MEFLYQGIISLKNMQLSSRVLTGSFFSGIGLDTGGLCTITGPWLNTSCYCIINGPWLDTSSSCIIYILTLVFIWSFLEPQREGQLQLENIVLFLMLASRSKPLATLFAGWTELEWPFSYIGDWFTYSSVWIIEQTRREVLIFLILLNKSRILSLSLHQSL